MSDQRTPEPNGAGEESAPEKEEEKDRPARMLDPAGMGDIPPEAAGDLDAGIPFREDGGPAGQD